MPRNSSGKQHEFVMSTHPLSTHAKRSTGKSFWACFLLAITKHRHKQKGQQLNHNKKEGHLKLFIVTGAKPSKISFHGKLRNKIQSRYASFLQPRYTHN